MAILLFILVFFTIYGFASFYIGIRFWQLFGSFLPLLNNKVYWVLFWFVASSFIIARISTRFLPVLINNIITIIGSYWMAVMLYSLIILIIIDLIRLISRFLGFRPHWMTFDNHKSTLILGICIIAVIGVTMVWGTWNALNIKIRHYDIDISKNAGQLKDLHAVLISDIHLGNIVTDKRLEKIVDKINALKPDIILIAGDTIDDNIEPFIRQNMAKTFAKLHSRFGTYAVLGNHEFYGSMAEDIVENYEKGSIKVLRDEYVNIDNSFYLAGREDSTNKKRKPLQQVIEGIDKAFPVILMDHNPVKLGEPEKNGIDLQLSGHTHAGQLFPGDIITHFIYADDWGYLRKGNFQLIVSSGAGTWGPPIRINTDSEIVDINIKFGQK